MKKFLIGITILVLGVVAFSDPIPIPRPETDPVFMASDANGINSTDIGYWNTAYGWGDHSGLYDAAGTASAAVMAHLIAFDHNDIGAGGSGDANAVMAEHLGTYDHNDIATAISWGDWGFEDFNDIYDCNIPMTDKLGGLYLGNFPSCDANSYTIMSYFDSDSTPDNNDVLIQIEEGYWTGTLWRSSRDRLEDIKAETGLIVEDTGTAIPNTLTALRSAMDANFASLDFDTSGIDANFVTLRNAMDANFANIDNDFPTTEEIRAEIDSNSTQLAAILEDTGTTIPSLITDVNIPDINSDLETIKTGIENILNRIIYKFIQINGD